MDEEAVLSRLPFYARQDLAKELVGTFMQNSELFRLMPASFQETSLTFLKPRQYARGEIICKQGDIGHEMFFIQSGDVSVMMDGVEVARLSAGDCVGEMALMERSLRTATATALSSCHLYALTMDDFNLVVSYHSGVKRVLSVMSFMRRNMVLGQVIRKAMRWSMRNGPSKKKRKVFAQWRINLVVSMRRQNQKSGSATIL